MFAPRSAGGRHGQASARVGTARARSARAKLEVMRASALKTGYPEYLSRQSVPLGPGGGAWPKGAVNGSLCVPDRVGGAAGPGRSSPEITMGAILLLVPARHDTLAVSESLQCMDGPMRTRGMASEPGWFGVGAVNPS
jgi:hypothetical protein